MNAEICIRCGLPNQKYLQVYGSDLAIQKFTYTPQDFNCVRCGLPNERFQKLAADNLKETLQSS